MRVLVQDIFPFLNYQTLTCFVPVTRNPKKNTVSSLKKLLIETSDLGVFLAFSLFMFITPISKEFHYFLIQESIFSLFDSASLRFLNSPGSSSPFPFQNLDPLKTSRTDLDFLKQLLLSSSKHFCVCLVFQWCHIVEFNSDF